MNLGRLCSTAPQMEDKIQSAPPPKGEDSGWAKSCGHEGPELSWFTTSLDLNHCLYIFLAA